MHKRTCALTRPPIDASVAQQAAMKELEPELFSAFQGHFSYTAATDEAEPGDIPTQFGVKVSWTDPRSGKGGRRTIKWYDAGSLASELWVLAVGALDQHVHLAGGPLMLVRELPDVMWSMAIHKRWTGLCVPPAQKPGQQWSTTWAGKHLQKSRAMARSETRESERHALALPSASAAASFCVAGKRMGFELPCFAASGSADVPTAVSSLPRWWTDATVPWERALSAFASALHTEELPAAAERAQPIPLPCMHFQTDKGCAAGPEACCALHDARWESFVQCMKRDAQALLGTGGDVLEDAYDKTTGSFFPTNLGEAQPVPNGLASSPAWQLPDAEAISFLAALQSQKRPKSAS